ncbi:MAG: hypothetical protein V9G12_04950 [Microthrixaceae bacterium]
MHLSMFGSTPPSLDSAGVVSSAIVSSVNASSVASSIVAALSSLPAVVAGALDAASPMVILPPPPPQALRARTAIRSGAR